MCRTETIDNLISGCSILAKREYQRKRERERQHFENGENSLKCSYRRKKKCKNFKMEKSGFGRKGRESPKLFLSHVEGESLGAMTQSIKGNLKKENVEEMVNVIRYHHLYYRIYP